MSLLVSTRRKKNQKTKQLILPEQPDKLKAAVVMKKLLFESLAIMLAVFVFGASDLLSQERFEDDRPRERGAFEEEFFDEESEEISLDDAKDFLEKNDPGRLSTSIIPWSDNFRNGIRLIRIISAIELTS
ncbi:MAG: hypothetical protein KAS70_02150 [Planctomycetes bacterium]|nr:hypothetical protein [Planctomycetota bacterium]